MREYDPKKDLISLGEACQNMYQMTWFDDDPVKMIWNDVEVIMKRVGTKSDE
ncbi:hypothetical protein ES703_09517 [subsurface metagenome]